MILRIQILSLILTLSFLSAFTQKLKKADKTTLANLQTHIQYLADDKLGGRRIGTPGERAAGDYISIAFAKAGLLPKGDKNGWRQSFEINEGRQISPETLFSLNDRSLVLYKEYFPLSFSAAKEISGTPAIALQERGDPWFLDLKDLLETGHNDPHFNLAEEIRAQAKESAKKGATALILYNSGKIADNLAFDPHDRSKPSVLPLIYITREAKRKYLKDESASLDIKISVGFTEKKRMGHNVLGYLDNGAASTVVIAAQYDHPGDGEDDNALSPDRSRAGQPGGTVFDGAGDNASGVAVMIELARLLKGAALKGNNYLFIAFSGGESGLSGSAWFAGHPTIELKKINCMIGLDKIGRVNDSTHALTIGGYESSPAWEGICKAVPDKKYFTFHFDTAGSTAGDHIPFYRRDIPVLFFSTGSDYRRPADDAGKVNYSGELMVLKYIYALLENINRKGRIAFSKSAWAR